MEAWIVSGGELEQEFIGSYQEKLAGALSFAVDSGMRFFYEQKRTPDYIVGDFDSAKPEILEYFQKQREKTKEKPVILQFQPEKDETDTELAIRTAIEQGCSRIYLFGATGSRLDHVLGNLHLLGMAMEQGVECLLLDRHNRIRLIKDRLILKKEEQYGDYVSLLPFTPKVEGLTLEGFKYPLDDYTLECYHSLGISNEITGEQAVISFRAGVLLVAESRD